MRRPALALAAAAALAAPGAADPPPDRARELAETTALLSRLSRPPPALALARGGTVEDVAHLTALRDAMRARVVALSAELAGKASAGAASPPAPPVAPKARPDPELTRLATLDGPVPPPDAPDRIAPPFRPGPYRLPIPGRVVAGLDDGDPGGTRARGLTLATRADRPVLAPAAGRVRYAAPFRVYGDIVILDHGRGWTSLVAGLQRSTVAVGDRIVGGAPIGVSGPRLMVELRHNGQPVDVVAMIWALGR